MGDLYLGGVEPVAIYLGDKAAVAAYLGTEHIWGPAIGDPIAFINGSMGTGRNAGAGSNRTAVGSMLIDEDAFDRMAIAFVAVSHDAWLNGIGDYGTFTMESHLDGPFQRREPVFFGRADQRQVSRQGSLTPFVLPRPSVGLHTITAFVEAPRWATQIEFQVQAYKNVLAVGNQTENWADRTEAKLAVVLETVRENITLCGVAHDRIELVSGGVNKPQRGSTIGGAVGGRGDYLTVLEAPLGTLAPTVSFASVEPAIWGAAAVELIGYQSGAFVPITAQWTTPGTYTYAIPAGATMFDLIACGGGAGSWGSNAGWTYGAEAGKWASTTLAKGSPQIPAGATTLTVVVGSGAPRVTGNTQGQDGQPSKIQRAGTDLLVAAPGTNNNVGTAEGQWAGNHERNGITYFGGAPTTGRNQDGNTPGGGAAGRYEWFQPGWAGGDGAVFIRAY